MKKFTIFNIFNIFIFICYIVLVQVQKHICVISVAFDDFWFSLLIITFGVSLICKSIIFKSDSSIWFGMLFFVNGCVLFVSYITKIDYTILWPTILSSIMLSSLFVALFFKDWFHCRICILFFIVSVWCYLYSLKIISLIWFVFFTILSFVFIVIMFKRIPINFRSNKKEK